MFSAQEPIVNAQRKILFEGNHENSSCTMCVERTYTEVKIAKIGSANQCPASLSCEEILWCYFLPMTVGKHVMVIMWWWLWNLLEILSPSTRNALNLSDSACEFLPMLQTEHVSSPHLLQTCINPDPKMTKKKGRGGRQSIPYHLFISTNEDG